MSLPDLSKWHEVPKDATIPAGTPYWRHDPEEDVGLYYGQGVDYGIGLAERWYDEDYYTKEPILPPAEAALEERAQKMFRTFWGSLDFQWEHKDDFVQDKWRNLAARYIEKETD